MNPTDLTIEILKGIRDEVHGLREDTNARFDHVTSRVDDVTSRIDGTNDRLDATNARLEETNMRLSRLERRQTDADVRVATLLTGVAGAVDEMRDLLRDDRALRGRVDDHERRIGDIERRG